MLKKISLLLLTAVLLAACNKPASKGKATPTPDNRRQLINALEYNKRPFMVVFPHSTNKLLTLLIDNVQPEFTTSTIDLEYLSGNALKGGRTSFNLPATLPHTQAFLLGSCSSGGKCSFDTNLISGDIKNRLDSGDSGAINILKSEFLFVTKGVVNTSDTRVTYTPKDKLVSQILQDTQGLPKSITGDLAYSPIAISSTVSKKVTGIINFNVSGVKSTMIYDGNNWQPLKSEITADAVNIALDQTPWSKTVDIIRDDLKGSSETVTLYLVGPILLQK